MDQLIFCILFGGSILPLAAILEKLLDNIEL